MGGLSKTIWKSNCMPARQERCEDDRAFLQDIPPRFPFLLLGLFLVLLGGLIRGSLRGRLKAARVFKGDQIHSGRWLSLPQAHETDWRSS